MLYVWIHPTVWEQDNTTWKLSTDNRCVILIARQYANAAAFLHATEILLGFSHVGVDLVHALLDSIQLFCTGKSEQQIRQAKQRNTVIRNVFERNWKVVTISMIQINGTHFMSGEKRAEGKGTSNKSRGELVQ